MFHVKHKPGRAARRMAAENAAWDRAYEAAAHRRMTLADIEHERRSRIIEENLAKVDASLARSRAWLAERES